MGLITPIHFVFMHQLYNQHHPDRACKAAQATIRILDFECPVVIIKDQANQGLIALIHFVFMHPLYNQHHPDRARKAAQATIRIFDFECPVVTIEDQAN